MSNYYESAKGLTITRERACHELKAHGVININEFFEELKAHGVVNVHEFFEELGFFSHYRAQDVLDWLGY